MTWTKEKTVFSDEFWSKPNGIAIFNFSEFKFTFHMISFWVYYLTYWTWNNWTIWINRVPLLIFTKILPQEKNLCFTLYKRNFPSSFIYIQIFMLQETKYAILACSPHVGIIARNMRYDCRVHHTFEKVWIWNKADYFSIGSLSVSFFLEMKQKIRGIHFTLKFNDWTKPFDQQEQLTSFWKLEPANIRWIAGIRCINFIIPFEH